MSYLSTAAAPPLRSSIFRDDEAVSAGLPRRLPGAVDPRFGDQLWDFNGVLKRPGNRPPSAWRIDFATLKEPVWNLRAREVAIISLNRQHEEVCDRGVYLPAGSLDVKTAQADFYHLRDLIDWSLRQGLPADLTLWCAADARRFIEQAGERLKADSLVTPMRMIRQLRDYGPALTGGGLSADPWPGQSLVAAANVTRTKTVTTPDIPPDAWFALVRNAWTYISVFGPDILRARAYWQQLQTVPKASRAEGERIARRWLADPANLVPIAGHGSSGVNWHLLSRMMRIDPASNIFLPVYPMGQELRQLARSVAQQGRTVCGLLPDLAHVERPDGTRGPWHPALHPRELWLETLALRNACYVFIAALSMMRDSEIREIAKDATVTQHYGSPAITSLKIKHDPNLPTEHWWIIEPVARAVVTAAQTTTHETLAFGGVTDAVVDGGFDSREMVADFIRRVNARRQHTGLAEVPEGRVTPHQFRKTMAMLARDFPGAEIALGIQLKHAASRALANRVTEGYYARSESWSKYFDQALAATRFDRLRDMYDAHRKGEVIGYGPGADRLRTAFDTVTAAAEQLRAGGQAQHGDARVEYELLRKTRFSIRFGKLNHCTMDDANPAGAKCIEDAIVPEGHIGPLIDRCQPGKCANSMFGPEHIPIWAVERTSLLKLIEVPRVPERKRRALQAQIDEVNDVLRKAPA